MCKRITGVIALAALGFLGGVAFAQEKPVVGDVKDGSLKGQALTFASYGGVFQDAQNSALKEFVERSGVALLNDGPTEIAKLQAQVESGNVTWDVVDTADLEPFAYCGTLFQKLDFSKLDISKIPEGQVGECSVPAANYGALLMYNTEKYKDNPPKSWVDFFDTENFPGVRALDGSGGLPGAGGLLEQAFKAAGGDPKAITVADIDKAIDVIRQLGPDTIYWKTGAESQMLAESGEVDMLLMWSGRATAAVKNGATYAPAWQDWLVVMDQLTIPVGAKNTEAAYALINAYLGKRSQEILTQQIPYTPVNIDAEPTVDEVTAAFLTNTPERRAQGYQPNIQFWVDNIAVAQEKWAALMAGN